MGVVKEGFIEISNWLNSEQNYEDGVYLFVRYGRNEQLKRLFPGRPERYAKKLAYELGKVIGIGVSPDVGETPVASGVLSKEPEKKGVWGVNYPPVVMRVIAEMARLYNERAMVKKQVNGIDGNDNESIKKRLELNGMIEQYSKRLEVLFGAKKAYLKEGVLPDESILWPNEEASAGVGTVGCREDELRKLVNRRNTLRSALTRARNMLEYGTQKKGNKRSPMPDCDKRRDLEVRIRENESELADLERRIEDAGECGAAPGVEEGE